MGQMRTLTINGEKYDIVPVVPASSVTLLANAWVADGDKHSQVVEVSGVTAHTKVDLQPTAEQLEEFHYKVLAFVTENDGGKVTVYSIGDKPENDHTIQITKTEVEGVGKIRGNTVGTTMPKPDWNQTDPKQADYIHNKPALYNIGSNNPYLYGEPVTQDILLSVNELITDRGAFVASGNAMRSDYIEITSDMQSITYKTHMGASGCAVAFYDADKKFLSNISFLGTGTMRNPVTIKLDKTYSQAKYFTAGCYDGDHIFYQYYSCYVTYLGQQIGEDKGLNILIFGDSITDAARITIDTNHCTSAYTKNQNSYVNAEGKTVTFEMWPNLLPNIIACKDIRNYALSGASYKDQARTAGSERMNVSYQIQVALNDRDNPNNVFPSSAYEPDIVIFALGTNDGAPNDTPESALSKIVLSADGYSVDVNSTLSALDRTNFCEAVMWAFLTIKQAFPMSLTFCVLPIQRANNEVNTGSLHEYLSRMANRYGIIVIDGAYEAGIVRDLEAWNGLGTMLKDGLHPNEKGQNLFTRMILAAVRRYYLPFDGMN